MDKADPSLRQGVCWLLACLTSQQHAIVPQGRICSDNFTCSHTETEVAGQTFYLTPSQYTDTWPTGPSTDPIMPGAWQDSHRSANFEVTGMTRPRKKSRRKRDLEADALTTRPMKAVLRQATLHVADRNNQTKKQITARCVSYSFQSIN